MRKFEAMKAVSQKENYSGTAVARTGIDTIHWRFKSQLCFRRKSNNKRSSTGDDGVSQLEICDFGGNWNVIPPALLPDHSDSEQRRWTGLRFKTEIESVLTCMADELTPFLSSLYGPPFVKIYLTD